METKSNMKSNSNSRQVIKKQLTNNEINRPPSALSNASNNVAHT